MEGGSLFNPGFLGGNFQWWVGQIADDSTWRDNNLTGRYENKDTPEGWGRRYKVRIIGLHDLGETEIPSDQLPWAQIMYPVTAGGGQASSGATSNLRQGMMVFGFFLDGQDQQIPVIMGVLGNNSPTPLATSTGNDRVTNQVPGTLATSGHARGKVAKSDKTLDRAPDVGLTTKKPKTAEQNQEEVILSKLDKSGSTPISATKNSPPSYTSKPLISGSLEDVLASEEAAYQAGLKELDKADAAAAERRKKREELKNRNNRANSPDAPAQPGATIEQVDAPHQLSAGDVKLQEKLETKIVLMKPDPDQKVQSAMKSLQTVIESLTKKIDKYLSTISSYIDQVSNVITSIKSAINSAAFEMSKYLKIVMDKVMEYLMKILNQTMAPIVSAIPSSMRFLFLDMKEMIAEMIKCLYTKLTGGLSDMLQGVLSEAFNLSALEAIARGPETRGTIRKNPKVPVCYAESVVGKILNSSSGPINEFNEGILDNVNTFLGDINSQIAGISDSMGDLSGMMGSITGNITSAMNFSNIQLNVFGCELSPQIAVSDFYTLATGGGSTEEQQLPSEKSVADSVSEVSTPETPGSTPYAVPTSQTPDVSTGSSKTYNQNSDGSTTVTRTDGSSYKINSDSSIVKGSDTQVSEDVSDALDIY